MIYRITCIFVFVTIVFTSCVSLNRSHPGVGRVKDYVFEHKDVPPAFNNYRIAFISDLHYKSLFNEKRLRRIVQTLNKLQPNVLLLGGDYHEGCTYVPELFAALSQVETEHGIWAVMGNHDYAECYEDIVGAMRENGVHLLEHRADTLKRKGENLILAGVRNPFKLQENGHSPSLELADSDFVVLLVHTPDYVEDVSVAHTDLALAGHTHGGQVTLFGWYAPALRSRYKQRFRTGLKHNSHGVPVIITNGIGTSRKNIRMFAPSEIVMVTLKCLD